MQRLIKTVIVVLVLANTTNKVVFAQDSDARGYMPAILNLLFQEVAPVPPAIPVLQNDGQALAGTEFRIEIDLQSDDLAGFVLEVVESEFPTTVLMGGTIIVDLSSNVPPGKKNILVQVRNTVTGATTEIALDFNVLSTEVVASGFIGSEGGKIANDWEDIVLTIPPGATAATSHFKILRGLGDSGRPIYSIASSEELTQTLSIRLPPELAIDDLIQEKQSTFPLDLVLWEEWEGMYITVEQNSLRNFTLNTVDIFNPLIARNRIPIENDLNIPSLLKIINPDKEPSAQLHSLCGEIDSIEPECLSRKPVLFVHGFDGSTNRKIESGGAGTWGDFPGLLSNNFAVFEYRWKSNGSFELASDDFAAALELISDKFDKKVHIVAHSFGGILARTYLQGYGRTIPYRDNAASLVTLGTPHSGIFDTETDRVGTDGVLRTFPRGQDTFFSNRVVFERCTAFTCHEAGEPTPRSFRVIEAQPDECKGGTFIVSLTCRTVLEVLQSVGAGVDISARIGLDSTSGSIINALHSDSPEHQLPVDTRVLVGLKIDRDNEVSCINPSEYGVIDGVERADRYLSGDGLITFAGQRFEHDAQDTVPINSLTVLDNDAEVTEKLLGIENSQAAPNTALPVELAYDTSDGCRRIRFTGYGHSEQTSGASTQMARVNDLMPIQDTGEAHASLQEVLEWLTNAPDIPYESERFVASFQISDATNSESLSDVRGEIVAGEIKVGEFSTNQNGVAMVNLPFIKNTHYSINLSRRGYRSEHLDQRIVTGNAVPLATSVIGFEMQPDVLGFGDLAILVLDNATGQPIEDATARINRNGVFRESSTNSSGARLVPNLVRGTYEVDVIAENYKAKKVFVTVAVETTNTVTVRLDLQILLPRLNDTGIVEGATFPTDHNTNCTGAVASEQDCAKGRDVILNFGDDGQAGFSFTKLDENGRELGANALNWSCVRDNVTGLTWESKTMDGSVSDRNIRIERSQVATKALEINLEQRCGFSDWRLPNAQEMVSIVHYGDRNPKIDLDYFRYVTPEGLANAEFWVTGSTFRNRASAIEFGQGQLLTRNTDFGPSNNYRFVRSVNPLLSTMVDNRDGTVTDTSLGLMWKKCSEGLSGSDCSTGQAIEYDFETALERAKAVNQADNYDDWRVPNLKEAFSLMFYFRDTETAETVFSNGDVGGTITSSPNFRRGGQSNRLNQFYIPSRYQIEFRDRDRAAYALRLVRTINELSPEL